VSERKQTQFKRHLESIIEGMGGMNEGMDGKGNEADANL